MKPMIIKSRNYALLAGALLCTVGLVTARASSSIVTFSVDMSTNIALGTFNPPPPLGTGTDVVNVRGTYNGWAGTQTPLVEVGSSTVYTNTVNDTSDANGAVMFYVFNIDGTTYESVASQHNRAARLPATSGASLVLPTPFFGDSGAQVTNNVTFQVDVSQQIQIGVFTNGINTVDVWGSFDGWAGGVLTNNPNILVTNQFGLVTSNVWVGTFPVTASPWSAQDFKYVIQPQVSYETVSAINQDGGGNRFFAFNPGSNVTLPLVNFSDAPYAPLSTVTFAVDMSVQIYYGNWNNSMGVFCQGINGDWNNDAPNTMTNNPTASNTNIYYVVYTLGQGSTVQYKFTYNGLSGTIYESPTSTGGNNRSYTRPTSSSASVPTVYFSDLSINDLLTTDTLVTFTVDMTNASQYPTGPAFNPGSDTVYINGSWLGWLGWNPINLAGYQLTNNPPGSEVYSGQFLIPKGSPIPVTYKYSINGLDNEAASNNNHVRYVRSTATGAYSFPMDAFGNQYNEPSFGQLAVGPISAGTVRLTWLGAPNVEVQTRTNLISGSWVSHPETAGTVWTAGTNSVNGLVSVTNWPAGGGTLFFRLIQQ